MSGPDRLRDTTDITDITDTTDIESAELIDHLTRILSEPGGGHDRPAVAGRLGLAWLEVYERSGNTDALATGLLRLHETVTAEPDHPDLPWWLYWLGLGYAERARRRRSVREYHRGLTWIWSAYARSVPGGPVRPRAARALVAVCWEQFWLVRLREPGHRPPARADVDRLIARIAPMLTTVADAADRPWARMAVGLAHLHRYELSGERTDLDRAIDLLAAASLWEVAKGTPLLAQVGSELANAWRQRGLLDNDGAALDRAIGAGRRVLYHEDLGDGPELLVLNFCLAYAHEAQWRARQRVEDLDGAVEAWRRLIDTDDLTPAQILAAHAAWPAE